MGSIANKDQCLQLVLFIQGALRGAALSCLRSGHSHEDIDQSFRSLSMYLTRHARRVETPRQLVKVVQAWADQVPRPFEKARYACLVEQVRDWTLSAVLKSMCLLLGWAGVFWLSVSGLICLLA